MKHVDMRSLAPEAQEERRRQVIGLRQAGQTYAAIAAQVGLTPTGVFDICKRFAARGRAGLKSRARGPAQGHGSLLAEEQEAEVQALIRKQMPDELGLPFALWSRAAVQALVRQRFGITVAVRTMGSYLARWGYTPQKPLRRAYEQDPAAVRRWLRREYPAMAARARAANGVIFWGDESGLRSDDVRGRSYAPRGETPVVRPNHRRANVGLVSAVTNRGEVRWMVLDGAIKASTLIRFLERLVRDAGRKVFLILDRLQVHRAGLVRTWLSGRGDQIEVFYLPPYSPDLNPDEGLNGDFKQAVTARPLARSKGQLKQAVVNHVRSLSKRPERIRSFFHHPQFRYAA
ncbi:IS630 family transposase [Roseomonas sp. KE2513]|uniref:IS630 family transposase n=1 Tax=Roseomonas sp. KE2513 TaxID=2479202 RepID=UPI0018DF54AE|nr:IS630 family transposase [Roseomonas sp. KE2513]MBI0539183.1 IS630 family transposase [Roseomonas sp. KE2513]